MSENKGKHESEGERARDSEKSCARDTQMRERKSERRRVWVRATERQFKGTRSDTERESTARGRNQACFFVGAGKYPKFCHI